MNKVFCVNCKFYKGSHYSTYYATCKIKKNEFGGSAILPPKDRNTYCREANADNNCREYVPASVFIAKRNRRKADRQTNLPYLG